MRLLTRLHRTPEPAPAAAAPVDPLAAAEAAEAATLLARAEAEHQAVVNAARIADAEAAAKIAAIEAKSRTEQDRRDARAADERARAAKAARETEAAAHRDQRAERGRTTRVKIAAYSERTRRLAVNIVVNVGCGIGQSLFFHEQQGLILLFAVLLAAGLELVSVTTLDYGLAARRDGRPYKLKFFTAALLAGGVAALNYAHWSNSTTQQGLAWPLAILSLLCPLLWAWYAAARDAETAPVLQVAGTAARTGTAAARQQQAIGTGQHGAARQQHDGSTRPASFTAYQWIMWLSDTRAAKRYAIRYSITNPQDAYRAAAQHAADIEAGERAAARRERQDLAYAEAGWEYAERLLAAEREQAAAALAELQADLGRAHELLAARPKELDAPARDRYLPTPDEVAAMPTDEEKRESARDAYRTARLDDVELTGPAIAAAYGMSESWARARTREVRKVLRVQLDDEERADERAEPSEAEGIGE
ncbi:hypothetical protein AB0F17_28595 [Nonomuraea sp. NPDC026600]|uniref:hypothetical protein n=1 Tax=Nonomuraea sp. NPDC026600 TaxID=3155363 RepID=UPI0033CDCD2B